MPFDGSGNFNRVMNWVSDALANIKIVATRHDSEDDNFASGLSNCLTKDGQTQPTANIPLNGKKIVNLAAPTVATDAATKGYTDTADALKAPLASPTFTGVPAAPTAVAGTNTTQLATTAFVTTADALKANLAGPTFTGVPAAPTAAPGTNTTQLSTTAFVTAAIAALSTVYQAASAVLTALAGVGTAVAGDIIYATGAGAWGRLAKGTASQEIRMNAGATAPEWFTPPFTKSFESTQQTITAAGSLTIAHGLGARPKLYLPYFQCVTAQGNYVAGDEVAANPNTNQQGSGSNGLSVFLDGATSVGIRFGSGVIPIFDKTTGALFNLTPANWKLVVRAWL